MTEQELAIIAELNPHFVATLNKLVAPAVTAEKELQSALRKQLKEEVGDQEFPKDNKHAQQKFQILRQKFGIIPPRYTESEREIINAGQ